MNFKKIIGITGFSTLATYYAYRNDLFFFKNEPKPIYITRKEISEHYNFNSRIWASYKDSVYDITDFIKVHPGGEEKIMLVAGGALEPFWEMYSFHKKEEIVSSLEKYKVGKLDPKDIINPKDIPNFDFLKKEDLWRSPYLKVLQTFPYCAEADDARLIRNFYTPSEDFFVRNHFSVPTLEIEDYFIEIKRQDQEETQRFFLNSIEDIFGTKNVVTMMTCSGNRREHFNSIKKTKGLTWGTGAMSNGNWSGVAVSDLLRSIGITEENCKGKHLIVTGNDKDFQGVHYSISIPLEHALEPSNMVLLATKYNGEEIPKEHGYPMRFVVPGYVGVRSVKWVKSLEISDNESKSSFQQKDYKIVYGVDWENFDKVDLSQYKPIMELDTNSAILYPKNGQNIVTEDGKLEIKGYAHGKWGIKVNRVEITFDDGKNWKSVDNVDFKNVSTDASKYFGWTLWKHKIELKEFNTQEVCFGVRVVDEEGNSQIENAKQLWNVRGLMNNSIHKVCVNSRI